MKSIIWIILGCISCSVTVQATSFDCAKTVTKIEKLICENVELSKLDEDLSKEYLRSLERSDIKQQAIKSQKQWLKDRRNTCLETECLKKVYETRIKELELMSSFGIVILSAPPNKGTPSIDAKKMPDGQVLQHAQIAPKSVSGGIDTIDIKTSDEIYLLKNHLIVSKTCSSDDAVYMNVYDRLTYQPIASIKVEDCDDEYQDSISNIVYLNGKYYLLMSYRWEEEASSDPRLKLVIVDASKLKITKTYTAVDVNQSDFVPSSKDFPSNTFLLSDKVHEVQLQRSDRPYVLTISLRNISSDISRELFRAATWHEDGRLANTFSNLAVIENILVLGMNRDLFIIDIQNSKYNVIHEYQNIGFSDNGFGVDRNKIDNLLFDDHTKRLLIFRFNGTENSFLSVDELKSMPNMPLQAVLPASAP